MFLDSPSNVSGPERCFVVALFTFKIKVSIIFENDTMKFSVNEAKLTQVCELGTVLLFKKFWILKFALVTF